MIELLAPAGNYETILAAYQAGADAVYVGGNRFGARAYAQNLGEEELLAAIDQAHFLGKKLYLTVNTLLKREELYQELYDYLQPLYSQGLDAVIVQDLGVMSWLREQFPGLPLHVSTQAAVTGPYGAKFLEELGASRVVPARELSLEEIRSIRRETDLEIETFIHGALCYCYSGMCLFSSMLGGRSGNRGRCAQPCRLPYQLFQGNRKISRQGQEYLLSPKDICTVDLLPQILEAGVTSLKIEGRMKRSEYTAGVVRIYRKYLDYCLEGKPRKISREDMAQLMLLFNRDGFSQGYYKTRNGRDMMALTNAKEKEREEGTTARKREALYEEIRECFQEKKVQEKIKGSLKLSVGSPAILELQKGGVNVCLQGEVVQEAKNQPLSRERILQQMEKTGNTPFVFEKLEILMEGPVFLPMQSINQLRRSGLEKLEQELLSPWRREKPLKMQMDGEGLPVKAEGMKNLFYASVETTEQLEVLLAEPEIYGVYAECSCFPEDRFLAETEHYLEKAKKVRKEFYLALPHVIRQGDLEKLRPAIESLYERGINGFLVRNLETLSFLCKLGLEESLVLDASVYTFNPESQKLIRKLGVSRDTVPVELNFREMRQRDNSNSELVVYGRQSLMISAQCLAKTTRGCDKKSGIYQLKDRYGKEFCVKCQCRFCYNIIYNSVPTDLSGELKEIRELSPRSLRLVFTLESGQQTRQVLDRFLAKKAGKEKILQGAAFTKGHFRRGVE